ncbi:MAG: helix-turn-helix transcriptional regulator [Nitrospirae bacterium]|nr:helix-turn-helix transcriptional regulator [Nitrospirota bacterium]
MAKPKDNCRKSGCPIAFTLDVIGDKWSLLIIRDMVFLGKRYYGEFLVSDEKIASNILADRLKRLEDTSIITKTLDPDNQKKYIYELTPKGIDLVPMILEVIRWGAKYDPETAAPKEFIRKLKKDKNALTIEIIDHLGQKGSFVKGKE